jgi:hypothetical protein|uniref:Uncharacterized protein n=1 Tax=virus sp. ctPYc18 TaxID=2828251 RepID=A0A8S5RD59_9VIRU|nr:MAG TPA: hypothetical protein [virus sp. ctPYc18]
MREEEYTREEESNKLHLHSYEAVGKFRSVRRAIRRNNVTPEGTIIPRRPFHNKANTSKRKGVHSRESNEEKKRIYASIKRAIARLQ